MKKIIFLGISEMVVIVMLGPEFYALALPLPS